MNDSLIHWCNALYQLCCDFDEQKHSCCFEDEFDVFTDYPRLYYAVYEKKILGFYLHISLMQTVWNSVFLYIRSSETDKSEPCY